MTDAQLKWLFQHLGHTENVHLLHYRSRSDIIERLEVAKLCSIQDHNLVGKYVAQNLEDIQFVGEIYNMESLKV